jgi:hypothetical protein
MPAIEVYRDREAAAFLVDDLLIYRDVGDEPPSNECWTGYLRALRSVVPRISRCLVIPRAAGLSPRQREDVRQLIGRRPTAVLTGSVVNRLIITSMSWFRVPVHVFAPTAHRAALAWLEREHLLDDVLRGLEHIAPSPLSSPPRRRSRGSSVPPRR